jgi:hypothetical protein
MQINHFPQLPAMVQFELDCVFTGSINSMNLDHQKIHEWISENM